MTTVMWFRRDLRLGDNPALLEACADGGVLPLFVLDPALWGPAGPSRRAYLAASLRALDGSLRQRRRRALGGPRRPGAPGGAGRPAVGAERVHVAADSAPTAAAATRRSSRRWPTPASSWCAPARRTPSPPAGSTNGSGDALQGLHAVLGAWAEHGWRGPVDPPHRTRAGWRSTGHRRHPGRRRCPTGSSCPRPARRRRGGAGGEFLDGGRRLRRRPRPARRRRHLADVASTSSGARSTRARCWPTSPGRAAPAPRRTARSWPGGSSTPTCCSTGRRPRASTCARSSRGCRTTSPATQLDAWQRGAHRLPDRRRRDAPAARDRLDAQPGADDRGQLPGQGPAPRVAARRPALHALARRRRPRLQPARLAVDRGLRHRRGAVLPGLQPDQPGPQVRPRRRLRPALGPGARPTPPTRTSRTRPRRSATRRRSSTTPRSGRRRWTGWERIRR